MHARNKAIGKGEQGLEVTVVNILLTEGNKD